MDRYFILFPAPRAEWRWVPFLLIKLSGKFEFLSKGKALPQFSYLFIFLFYELFEFAYVNFGIG